MADIREEMLERLLTDSGIAPGMRVLDVGCGRGDVAVKVLRLVGDSGEVVGIDREPAPLEAAREQASALGFHNATFIECDLAALPPDLGAFDAIVGRRVLMYLPDATQVLRALAEILRPGGLMVFQEQGTTGLPISSTPLPLHAQVHEWMWRTVKSEGADIHMDFHLPAALKAAGLIIEQIRAEAVVQTPDTRYPTATIIRAMLPRIVGHGIATEAEIGVDTLEQRLIAEREQADASYIGDMLFGAWATKPL